MRSYSLSIVAGLALLCFATVPALAQPPRPDPPPVPAVPNISGTWYMNGNPDQPCDITQHRGGTRAEFINEHGSHAWGTVYPDAVWIPDWTDGVHQGLWGTIRRNRIVWPNGSYWSRFPQ